MKHKIFSVVYLLLHPKEALCDLRIRECQMHKRNRVDPDTTIPDGDLEGWEIMLKVVTNGLGQSAIVLQSNVVYEGPTDDMQQIVDRIAEYMLED